MKRYATHLLKAAFVFGLLYFLYRKGLLSVSETKRAFSNWENILLGVSLLSFNLILGALRWQWLLEAQGIQMRWRRVFELTLVGNFFNIALPGAVSGDFVKAFYIGKEIEGKRAHAFGSILFDRVAGLSALVLVSGVAMGLGLDSFHHDSLGDAMLTAIRPFVIFSAVGVVAFYSYLFLVREHLDPVLRTLRRIERRITKAHSLTKIYLGLRTYHHHRTTVLKVFLLSVFIHSLVGIAFINFASALGDSQLSPYGIYTVFPLGLLVTAIPVAPAGVGTGHAAFAYFFKLLGSARGADIFTLFAIANFFFGAIGGLVYLRFRTQVAPAPDTETESELLQTQTPETDPA